MASGPDFSARATALPDFSGRAAGGGRRPAYFETSRGRATVYDQPDGSLWLETDDGYSGGLERFPGARPVFAELASQPAPKVAESARTEVRPRRRDLGERFTSVVTDAARRNPTVAVARFLTDRGEDAREVVDPQTGRSITFTTVGGQMRQSERERREIYQHEADADGWRQAEGGVVGRGVAGVTNVAGAIAGAAADPTALIGGAGKTIVGRILGNVGVNAAGDVVTQGADVGADIQDRYSPLQTVAAGAIGGVISGGMEVAPSVVRGVTTGVRRGGAALADFSSRARNPVPSFDGVAMDAGPVSGPSPAPRRRATEPVSFTAPVEGRVSSGFGPRQRPNARASANHQGMDYAVPEGTPVRSAADGEVIFAGPRGNYGNRVVVRHADGSETSYSHLSGFDVRVGDRVTAGQPVARSGSTGNVTGPHLHFEVKRGGGYVDPQGVLSGDAPLATTVRAPGDLPDFSARAAPITPSTPADAGPMQALGVASRRLTPEQLGIDTPRLAVVDEPQAATFRAEDTPNGFRVFEQGRLRDRPMLWGERQGADIRVESAALPPEMRGRGQGVEVYAQAADAATSGGGRLLSDGIVSGDAARMYEALGRRGFTVTRDPTAFEARGGWETPDGRPVFAVSRQAAPDFTPRAVAADARPGLPDFSSRATSDRLAIDMSAYGEQIGQTEAATVRSSGQTIGGLREAPRPGAVERGQGAVYQGKTVSQLADDLRASLGLTQRQGRVSMKRAAGEYDTGTGVIRTRAVDELDVISHEAFHAFEYEKQGPALAAALKANAPHLKTLAYPGAPANVARQEGFAEFGRWYLTNPDHARRIAPHFYRAFEDALAQDAPDVLAKMQAIQAGYRNVLDSASIDVATGSIAYTGRKGTLPDLIDEMKRRGVGSTIQRLADDAYTAFVDDLHPLSVAVRKLTNLYVQNTGQKLDLKRAADPYALARLSREAYAAGHSDLLHGVTPYRGIDPEGVSLADALETAGIATTRLGSLDPKATREFDAYLISRRMVHEWDRYAAGDLPNPPDRNTKQFHEQVIADADAAHPTWAKAAAQAYEFQNNLWRKEYEAGLITEASYRNGLDQHPDYVPLMRDMSDRGPGGAGKPRGALQFAGGVKAFEGSSRDIISPLSSIIRRSYELNAIIKRNDTLKALDDLAQAAGRGSGAIVERLPAQQIEAFTVQAADALQKTADEMGLTGRDLSTVQKLADDATNQDATITLFKQSEFSPRKGEAVVFVWRDGKKTPLLLADGEFGQQMFQALAGMNRDLQNVVVETMAAMTQTLRYGVTLSPEFMAANIIRDQVATWINSDVGFVPVVDMVRGAASVIRQDANALRYANAGGMTGGANVAATRKPFPKTDAEAQAQLQMLRKKGYNIRRMALGPWRALAELTDLSETSTRLGVFKRGFDQAKARGLSDYEALIESGFTSRDYLDFGRHGSKMISAARIVTFLNAALQGLDKSLRVLTAGGNLKRVLAPMLKEARTSAEQRALGHAYKAWAKIAALGAFGLGLRMLYADDPEYQEIGDQLRATNWIFRARGQWVFIPKPFELATISNILERGFEGTVLKDPTAGERLLSDFRHTIAPPHEIPALSVPFQIGANRDHLGRPIVPDHLRGTVDPGLQFNAYTSDLGKLIGRTFKVSPAVVDHFVTGYGGSLGRYALQASNLVAEAATGRPRTAAGPEDWFLSRRFIRDISRGSTSQAEFWDDVSKDGGRLTRAEGSFRSLMRDGKDAEGAAYLNRLKPDERAWVVAKVFGAEGEGRLHPLARTQALVSLIGDFRSSVRNGELRDPTGQVIPLSPRDRRTIDSALSDFALAEMRSALVASGARGWRQKQLMDAAAPVARIERVVPAVRDALSTWIENEKLPTVLHPQERDAADMAWQARRPVYEATVPADFVMQQMRIERAKEGAKRSRYQEELRNRGGAYAPPVNAPDFSARAA